MLDVRHTPCKKLIIMPASYELLAFRYQLSCRAFDVGATSRSVCRSVFIKRIIIAVTS